MIRVLKGCFLTALPIALALRPAVSQPGVADAAKFVGTWRLISIDGDSVTLRRVGPHPTGIIVYDATNHMSVQIQPDRQRPSWPWSRTPSPTEALAAIDGYTAYFGTYAVDPHAHTVTHHREGALDFDAVDYVRKYELQANGRLTLMPVDLRGVRLVWERVR
jgi:hypothetical protein